MGHYFSISGLVGSDLWTIDHEDVTGGVGEPGPAFPALPGPQPSH